MLPDGLFVQHGQLVEVSRGLEILRSKLQLLKQSGIVRDVFVAMANQRPKILVLQFRQFGC